MKNSMLVLAVCAVIGCVSSDLLTDIRDDASNEGIAKVSDHQFQAEETGEGQLLCESIADDNLPGSNQCVSESEDEETDDGLLPFEPFIDERPPASSEEWVPPETAGTITCSGRGPTIRVEIKGNLMIGLMSPLPLKMMRRISLTKEGHACWGGALWSGCAVTQPICTKINKHELVCQHPTAVHAVFRDVQRMSFVPQIGGYGVFDLKRWQVVGCVREGCDGVCRSGEKCRPGPGCAINGR